jgi:hypothetical protein
MNNLTLRSATECVKNYMNNSEQSIIPDFLVDIVDVKPDGSCQFRALANNIKSLTDDRRSEYEIAKILYSKVKSVIVDVLPRLSNEQLVTEFGLVETDFDLTPIENLNNIIKEYHSPSDIYNLQGYYQNFKYGVYTTNLELRILLSDYLISFWTGAFLMRPPCVQIYIHNKKGSYLEINCLNRNSMDFICFRLYYINSNHYQCIYIKERYFDTFNEVILRNSCKIN